MKIGKWQDKIYFFKFIFPFSKRNNIKEENFTLKIMNSNSKYIYETVGYGIFIILGFFGTVYFFIGRQYFLVIICFLIFLVALDNFFCGRRLRKCNINTKSHYTIPPFLNKKFILSAFIFIFLLVIVITFSHKSSVSENYTAEVVVDSLEVPWALDFLPDERMIFTERKGIVSIFDGNVKRVVGKIPATEISESGLLGITVDPDFDNNHFIYVYYSYQDKNYVFNRVSRYVLDDEISDEHIILDKIPSARFHDGGRIKFGPDGMLYITTGDATDPSSAQNINSLAGKILRINNDGSIPEDNLFRNYVYSYGHRNPQGITWHPISGELYASEHGPTRNDEINLIVKGENYGWPETCDKSSDDYARPLRCYSEFTLAPSGIAFYNGDLYVAGLRGSQLRKIVFGADYKKILREEELFNSLGRIRDVVEYNGYLYIATSNRDGRGMPQLHDDKIIRIKKLL